MASRSFHLNGMIRQFGLSRHATHRSSITIIDEVAYAPPILVARARGRAPWTLATAIQEAIRALSIFSWIPLSRHIRNPDRWGQRQVATFIPSPPPSRHRTCGTGISLTPKTRSSHTSTIKITTMLIINLMGERVVVDDVDTANQLTSHPFSTFLPKPVPRRREDPPVLKSHE